MVVDSKYLLYDYGKGDIGWVILLKEASWGYEKEKMQLLFVFCVIRGVIYLICCGYDYGKGDYALLLVDEV